jgi:hypothetical protein
MSRRGQSPLAGWKRVADPTRGCSFLFQHGTRPGAMVVRMVNPATEIIEWGRYAPGDEVTFTGQDLHDAVELALHTED